jgi:hypothetical protein
MSETATRGFGDAASNKTPSGTVNGKPLIELVPVNLTVNDQVCTITVEPREPELATCTSSEREPGELHE